MAVAPFQNSKRQVFHQKVFTTIKRQIWFLAAFFIPLSIRSIPEILSWSYPLGLDTLRYIQTIESGQAFSSILAFLRIQLFYPLGTLTYWLTGDAIVVIKVFGPLLMAFVAIMMYLYARRGLGWSEFKSFLVSLFVTIYFVTLRNSWDLYAQSLGLIFLFATLIVLKSSFSLPRRHVLALIFILLTVASHQLVSVILFFILTLTAVRLLFKRSYRDFCFTFLGLGLAGGLFLFRAYSEAAGSIVIPTAGAIAEPSFAFASTLAGLLIYGYGLLLPFVFVSWIRLKDWFLKSWIIWCVVAMLLLIAFPTLPLYYWPRWFYLLAYPLLFFAIDGLDRLYRVWSKHNNKIKRSIPKVFALTYVALLLGLSGFYLAADPENQIPFFSVNPYLTYIPSSMLQNTLPIRDNPSLVNCFNWINNRTSQDSVVITHYALFDLARIYIHDIKVVNVLNPSSIYVHSRNETALLDGLISASQAALVAGNSTVYTVWWVNGEGWHQISSLPPFFVEVYRSDIMAVYIFTEGA